MTPHLTFASCLILKCKYSARKKKLQIRSTTAAVGLTASLLLPSGQTSTTSINLARDQVD